MLFISSQKLFWFSRYLNFYHEFLGMWKKRLDQKDQVNFEIHDVTTWLPKNTIHILLNISRIKDNQTMKFNKLTEYPKKNIFFKKIMQKMRRGNQFQTTFYILKNFYIRKKQVVCILILLCFDSLQINIQQKQTV